MGRENHEETGKGQHQTGPLRKSTFSSQTVAVQGDIAWSSGAARRDTTAPPIQIPNHTNRSGETDETDVEACSDFGDSCSDSVPEGVDSSSGEEYQVQQEREESDSDTGSDSDATEVPWSEVEDLCREHGLVAIQRDVALVSGAGRRDTTAPLVQALTRAERSAKTEISDAETSSDLADYFRESMQEGIDSLAGQEHQIQQEQEESLRDIGSDSHALGMQQWSKAGDPYTVPGIVPIEWDVASVSGTGRRDTTAPHTHPEHGRVTESLIPGHTAHRQSGSVRGGGTGGQKGEHASNVIVEEHARTPIYEFDQVDFATEAFRVKLTQLSIFLTEDDSIPQDVRQGLSKSMYAVHTNGDGACALHSVFGRPGPRGELFVRGARELAVRLLQALAQDSSGDPCTTDALQSIQTSLWTELAKPILDGHPSEEGHAFWKALTVTSPMLAEEARRCHRESRTSLETYNKIKREAIVASRAFFRPEFERNVVRPLAVRCGYMIADVDLITAANGCTVSLRHASLFRDRFVSPGLERAQTEDGYVKGTRIKFPADGPDCKYCALFDARPEFDALREIFLITADPNSKVDTFLRSANDAGLTTASGPGANQSFLTKVQNWAAFALATDEPAAFGARAWESYLACVRCPQYFFSVDELVGMCIMARINVAIFTNVGSRLTFAAGFFGAPGLLVCTKLSYDPNKRVRSHFERLLSKEAADSYAEAVYREVQRKIHLEIEARRRNGKVKLHSRHHRSRLLSRTS